MQQISSVAIVCGTHGNEYTGIYLHKQWQANPEQLKRDTFETQTLLANHEAHQQNRRYLDADLNRQFKQSDLDNPQLNNHEQKRAKEINQILGPKEDPKTDLVIDLHNTTSNMGPCLLMPQNGEFYRKLAGYITLKMPQVNITRDEDHKPRAEHHLLATLGKFGVIIEVGPVNQSVLNHKVYQQAEQMTQHILDFVERYNRNDLPQLPDKVTAYRYLASLTLPMDENGQRLGMVHQDIDRQDFKPLSPGDAIFQRFDGTVDYYQGDKVVYPNFINEAAYYDNNLAMSLAEKVEIEVYL